MDVRKWSALAALASVAIVLSLVLPWFKGYDDTGTYTATGWDAFDNLDTQLTATAFVALVCAVVIFASPRRAPALSLLSGCVGVFVFVQVLRLGLLGHADHDPSLHHPEVGVHVAMASGAILAIASAVLRNAGEPRWSIFRPTS